VGVWICGLRRVRVPCALGVQWLSLCVPGVDVLRVELLKWYSSKTTPSATSKNLESSVLFDMSIWKATLCISDSFPLHFAVDNCSYVVTRVQ
jgi:hypothetical protein